VPEFAVGRKVAQARPTSLPALPVAFIQRSRPDPIRPRNRAVLRRSPRLQEHAFRWQVLFW